LRSGSAAALAAPNRLGPLSAARRRAFEQRIEHFFGVEARPKASHVVEPRSAGARVVHEFEASAAPNLTWYAWDEPLDDGTSEIVVVARTRAIAAPEDAVGAFHASASTDPTGLP
jgi:hypothetical protein